MGKTIKKILIGILVILGILFILILLMPDDDADMKSQSIETSAEKEESSSEEADSTSEKEDSSSEEADSSSEKEESSGNKRDDASPGGRGKDTDVEAVSAGTDAANATVMVYMNGSDLETEAGEATTDISEMLSSGIGDNVNVVIQTMGLA